MRVYPNISGPIEQMRRLNADGEAYWLEDIRFATGVIQRATVHTIGSDWIEIQEVHTDQLTWIRVDHIVSLNIVEG